MQPVLKFREAEEDREYLVDYQPYDPALPEVFRQVKQLVQKAAGAVVVEHIGSSSIPGMGGRNVLDVAVPVDAEEIPCIRRKLCTLGFQESPFPHYLPLLVGRIDYHEKRYPILLYLLPSESGVYQDWIAFRDYMRTHPETARAYDEVKQRAVAEGETGGEDYQKAKTPFLESISKEIRRWKSGA